jgi:hypothetical protein
MPAGRPTDYNQALADTICEAISEGRSLREICREEDMPSKASIFRWLGLHKEFSDQYARAREEQAESLADEIVHLADTASNPVMVDGIPLLDSEGNPVLLADTASIAHARLRVDARKWVASKLKPKRYGDKLDIDQNVSGGISIEVIERVIVDPKK